MNPEVMFNRRIGHGHIETSPCERTSTGKGLLGLVVGEGSFMLMDTKDSRKETLYQKAVVHLGRGPWVEARCQEVVGGAWMTLGKFMGWCVSI